MVVVCLSLASCAHLAPVLAAGARAVLGTVDWNRIAQCATVPEREQARCLGMEPTPAAERVGHRCVVELRNGPPDGELERIEAARLIERAREEGAEL